MESKNLVQWFEELFRDTMEARIPAFEGLMESTVRLNPEKVPFIVFNGRLSTSAGRFHPGYFSRRKNKYIRPIIEIASYLKEIENAEHHIRDTLLHEMLHYYLWLSQKPHGHTKLFNKYLKIIGASRFNPVPKLKPPKHLYGCPACKKEYPAKRRLGVVACSTCCKEKNAGRYTSRFRLELLRSL